MGNAVVAKRLDAKQAQELGGIYWDEDMFNSLAEGSRDGKVSKGKLVKAMQQMKLRLEKEKANPQAGALELIQDELRLEEELREEKRAEVKKRQKITKLIKLKSDWGTMRPTEESAALIEDIGGAEKVVAILDKFYTFVFADVWLDQFVRSHDDPHGERLGLWIVEKMTGEKVWSSRRPKDARQIAHHDAWTSPKRDPGKHGRRFKLDDCRMWMRHFFRAVRAEGCDAHEPFWNFMLQFIQHFISVYERSAPPYTKESAMWSADLKNIEEYKLNGNLMKDVVNVGVYY